MISKIADTCAVLAFLLGWLGTAIAQEQSQSSNALEQLPGLNAAQQQMARSTDRVCVALNERGQIQRENQSQQSLRRNCSSLVNDAAGHDVYPSQKLDDPPVLRFGLTQAEFATVLQQMAGEEAQAPRLLIPRGQFAISELLQQRMAALRTSTSHDGIVQFDVNGLTQPRQYASLDPAQTTQAGARIEEPAYFGPWGFFLIGNVSFGNQDSTPEIGAFSFGGYTIAAGVDYHVLNNMIVGVALGFNHSSIDFDAAPNSAPNQYLDNDSYYLSAYSTYFLPKEFYVDSTISFAHNDFSSRRFINIPSHVLTEGGTPAINNRLLNADYGGTQFGFSLGGGRDWSFDALTINT